MSGAMVFLYVQLDFTINKKKAKKIAAFAKGCHEATKYRYHPSSTTAKKASYDRGLPWCDLNTTTND